ncbi:DUF2087 domain-containing protein [Georgenia sp. Z1491]|uniref:DUF2087 domain-containing protein n=1 Tax=Georgenia sp. Z1491 TaxID=3416707 RepID=UPI003CF302B7
MRASPQHADWRPLIAALANPHCRLVFSQIVVGESAEVIGSDLGPTRRRRTLDALVRSGLVREEEGTFVACSDVFADALAAGASDRPQGPERFLDGEGRIDRYPTDLDERRALLHLLARKTIGEGEVLPERELSERLTAFADDTARLRREMIDHEVMERTPSGSEYARVLDNESADVVAGPSRCDTNGGGGDQGSADPSR